MVLRRAFLVLLLMVAPLAGCISDPSDETITPTQGPDVVPNLFRTAVDLGSKTRVGAFGTSCQDSLVDGDCGLGEPSVEVAGDGAIYVSGVCCLTVPPPVYVSRDGGATFSELATTTGVREAFGIEGDFAIDPDGNVYFSDIEFAATFQITAWDSDGTFQHHTKWPAPPLVDRDWIRSDRSGGLYYAYNTGTSTNVYTSTDQGRAWSPIAVYTAPFGLGNIATGAGERELWLVGGSDDGMRVAHHTDDGGQSWQAETTSAPAGGGFPVPVVDEAGTLYVGSSADEAITVAARGVEGWLAPSAVTTNGTHRMSWLAAGAPGALAVAWYGTDDDEVGDGSEWFLHVAWSTDAHRGPDATWNVAIADPEPVFVGRLARDLLDFLQVDLGPDGSIHVAYSKVREETGNHEQLHYVRTEPNAGLAMSAFWWGP